MPFTNENKASIKLIQEKEYGAKRLGKSFWQNKQNDIGIRLLGPTCTVTENVKNAFFKTRAPVHLFGDYRPKLH